MIRARVARTLATIILLGLVAGGPGPSADETESRQDDPDNRDPIPTEIIVTARAPGETTASSPGVLVLDLERLRQEGDVTVADVLRRLPGVDLQQRGSAFESSTVRIRGSDAEQVLILRDGHPVSDSRSSMVDMNRISLDGVERIEVILGPATALYGAGGAAGAINLISADAAETLPGNEGSARATWGSFGEYNLEAGNTTTVLHRQEGRRTVVDAGVSGVIAENTYRYDRAGARETRRNAGGEEGSIRVAVEHVTPGYRAGIEGSISAFRRGLPGTVEFPAVSAELREDRYALLLRGRLGQGGRTPAWTLSGETGITRSSRSYRDPDYPLGALESDSDLTLVTGTLTPAGPLGPFSIRIPLSARGEVLDDSALGERDRLVLAVAPAARTAIAVRNGSEFDLSVHTRLEAPDPVDTLLPSGRAGVGWTAARLPFWIGTSVATGYRLPDFSELFLERSAFAVGNPDLEPERSRSLEVEARFGGLLVQPAAEGDLLAASPLLTSLGMRVAAHATEYQELIQWLPDPNGFWRPRNTGAALVRGIEADVETRTPLGFSPWTAEGNVGADILQALDRNEGVTFDQQLPYRAALAFRAGAGLEHLLGHRVSVSAEGRGARPVTRQNTVWLDPYLRLDAAASLAIVYERAYLGAAVRNILDEQFVETRFYPNPGREFRLSLEVRW
ncbi:MAG: TonB-dependent receptor [Spirochaetaceae bacterium]|nr:MAG: TonB-dependent receptor [Spirochaetaceae bacterium]